MRIAIQIASAILLAGCSVGITKNGAHPQDSFSVPVSYQEAFRRAESSLRECHSDSNPFLKAKYVNGNLFTDQPSGTVRVTMEGWANDIVRVDVRAESKDSTHVDIVVWGGPTWDEQEIKAIRASIEAGRTVCREPKYENPIR